MNKLSRHRMVLHGYYKKVVSQDRMASRETLKRLVTCQGGIQLIAALAVLNYRSSEARMPGPACRDHLVIYDLYAPPGQIREFANFIRRMATEAHEWESITYVDPEQMDCFADDLIQQGPRATFGRVYDLLGQSEVDEIYLSRNWQFGNQLFINAFEKAEKICYGDSIGIYFSEAYFSPRAPTASAAPNGFSLRGKFRSFTERLRRSNPAPPSLKEIGFDVGYFLLPDILGESPPMKTRPIEKHYTLQVFEKLSGLLEEELSSLRTKLAGRPAIILMTSNFSEAGRMSVENELTAYVKYLERLECVSTSVVIVKPHPRDNAGKIERLRAHLSGVGSEVILLNEAELFFLPFEIVLMRVCAGDDGKVSRDIKVVTFSTACLSLALLFNLKPFIGFGPELVDEYFCQNHAPGRVRHEGDLVRAVQKIAEGPVRHEVS